MNAMIAPPPLKLRSTIIERPDGMQITIPIARGAAWLFGSLGVLSALTLGMILWGVYTNSQVSKPSDLVFMLIMVAWFALGIVGLLCALGGRTVLSLKPNCLVVKREVFGLGWTRRLDASDLFNLRAYRELKNDDDTYTVPGVLADCRGKTCRISGSMFGGNLSLDEAEYLVHQIAQRYPSVNVLPTPPEPREITKTIFLLGLIKVQVKVRE
jgi:hypothetical protein